MNSNHNNHQRRIALSSDAVSAMLQGHRSVAFPKSPLVVQLSARTHEAEWDADEQQRARRQRRSSEDNDDDFRRRMVWVEDATSRVRARLVGPALSLVTASSSSSSCLPCRALVKGYVTCEVNPGNPRPVLFLADIQIIAARYQDSGSSGGTTRPAATVPQSRVPGGTIFEFLHCGMADSLTLSQLGTADGDCAVVSRFLEHVRAVETLQSSSWGTPPIVPMASSSSSSSSSGSMASNSSSLPAAPPPAPGGDSSPGRARTAFAAAVGEFELSQLDRQAATLAAHVSRSPDQAELVVSQHRQAVMAAMRHGAAAGSVASSFTASNSNALTVEVLCEWHKTACQGLIKSTAGQTRTNAVRVGHVTFRPPADVRSDLVKVCTGLSVIEARLRTLDATSTASGRNSNHHNSHTLGSRAALYASIVFFAVVDTHAFSDGNGRLARIAANYALRRFGFPVPVALFATPSQRKEYTQATVQTRRNLYLLARGNVTNETLLEAFAVAGAFTPLLKLFLDRMEKAVVELTNLVQDKQRVVQEEAHHQAAREFRERAAQGTCLICFDDAPNITTLCCGKAVHLNCMAEWLASKTSCPNCRGEFPPLPHRIGRQPVVEEDNDEDENTTSASDDEDDQDNNSTMSDQEAGSTSSTTSEGRRLMAGFSEASRRIDELAQLVGAYEAPDDTTSMDDDDDDDYPHRVAASPAAVGAAPMSTDDTVDDDDDTTEDDAPDPDKCRNCHNKAAQDCQNGLCGRCCPTVGQFQCARHGILE
jgi:fido (protein-threonine AMPylation protein)